MKHIKFLLFLYPLFLNAQNGEQLIRIHTVANTTDMNNVSNANEGIIIYIFNLMTKFIILMQVLGKLYPLAGQLVVGH